MNHDPRTLEEAIENNLSPMRITNWHRVYCECGHSVSFHFWTGMCKGAAFQGCKCETPHGAAVEEASQT